MNQACFVGALHAEETLVVISQVIGFNGEVALIAVIPASSESQSRRDTLDPNGLAYLHYSIQVSDVLYTIVGYVEIVLSCMDQSNQIECA
jgi:hypothetical protein